MPDGYGEILAAIKARVASERLRVVLAANSAMVTLYRDIGTTILGGAKVIDRLSADLRYAFPEMRGFSPRNLKYMRAFAAAWPDRAFVQQVAAQIPWSQNCVLLDRIQTRSAREWYLRAISTHGWSRSVLESQIERRAHERHGKALTNFETTLAGRSPDVAAQVFKDPYVFDFLGTADTRREREVEQALVDHIQRFLLEMGSGFAFVGRQVHLEFASRDYYLDLLFYHLTLRCFVVVELKAVPFEPEFVGKLNVYLSAVDDLMRHPADAPTIGLLLCRSKDELVVEYALRDLKKPIGVAAWETKIVESLPKELEGALPTVAQIEAELAGVGDGGGGR
jgi:predicted nuclease of restriction endonuclease-like (RecB) superfamily